jgi:hypothetical protein
MPSQSDPELEKFMKNWTHQYNPRKENDKGGGNGRESESKK